MSRGEPSDYSKAIFEKYGLSPDGWGWDIHRLTQNARESPWTKVLTPGLVRLVDEDGGDEVHVRAMNDSDLHAVFGVFSANGSEASPSAILDTEILGDVQFGGYTGAAFAAGAMFRAIAEGNFTGAADINYTIDEQMSTPVGIDTASGGLFKAWDRGGNEVAAFDGTFGFYINSSQQLAILTQSDTFDSSGDPHHCAYIGPGFISPVTTDSMCVVWNILEDVNATGFAFNRAGAAVFIQEGMGFYAAGERVGGNTGGANILYVWEQLANGTFNTLGTTTVANDFLGSGTHPWLRLRASNEGSQMRVHFEYGDSISGPWTEFPDFVGGLTTTNVFTSGRPGFALYNANTGSNPPNELHLGRQMFFCGGNDNPTALEVYTAEGAALQLRQKWYSNGDIGMGPDLELVFLDWTNDRVGINNPTPLCTLDVLGDVCIDGDFTIADGNTITLPAGSVDLSFLEPASAASRLLGRGSAAGGGTWEEITLDGGLSMTGTVLSAAQTAIHSPLVEAGVNDPPDFILDTDGDLIMAPIA